MLHKYRQLSVFAQELLHQNTIEEGLPLISKYIKEILEADRCSIFIFDTSKLELWTMLADNTTKINVDSHKGLVGQTLQTKKSIVENNPYSNPNFLKQVDEESGYVTKNVITTPIFNSQRVVTGILQLLNKDGGFDDKDLKFMTLFANYVSGFLEVAELAKLEAK